MPTIIRSYIIRRLKALEYNMDCFTTFLWSRFCTFLNECKRVFFLIIIITPLLISCGKKNKKLEKTVISFVTTSDALKGGAYIYGERLNGPTPATFSTGFILTKNEIEVEILGGQWRFLAIGWEGPNALEGNNRCAMAYEDIKEGNKIIFRYGIRADSGAGNRILFSKK